MGVRKLTGTYGQPKADVEAEAWHRVMLIGPTGTGKSSQIPTLAGPKFLYAFDPNCARTVQRWLSPEDVILEFTPDEDELDLLPRDVKTRVGGNVNDIRPRLYEDWLDDFRARKADGEFTELGKAGGWIGIDSYTFLQEAISDAVKVLQARAGSREQRSDATIIGQRGTGILRMLSDVRCNILMTAHYRRWKNEDDPKPTIEMEAYGNARRLMPGGFDNVWSTFVEVAPRRKRKDEEEDDARYLIQTVPEDDCPLTRSSITVDGHPLSYLEDVTIDWTKDPVGQGIGRWLNPATQEAPRGGKSRSSKEKAA